LPIPEDDVEEVVELCRISSVLVVKLYIVI